MKWQVGLYVAAVLIPLAAFAIEVIFIRQLKRLCAYLATGAIGLSFLLSLRFRRLLFVEAEGVFAEHPPPSAPRPEARDIGRARTEAKGEALAHAAAHGPHVWQASFDWVLLGGKPLAGPTNDPLAGKTLSFPAGRLHRQPVGDHVPDGHVRRNPDPYLFDGVHARRLAVSAVLRLPLALLLLDARAGGLIECVHDLHLLGAGRHLLLPPDRLLVRGEDQLRRGQQGVHRQPDRRRRDAGRAGALWTSLGTFNFQEISEGLHGPDG